MDNQKKIEEIDERIKDLREHITMWSKAGGMGGRMAMEAVCEINRLEEEKKLLESGKSYDDIQYLRTLREEIRRLKQLREEVLFLKRIKISKDLKKLFEECEEVEARLGK